MTRIVLFASFVATVWISNWVVSHYGIVPVGFGLQGPAAVYVVGVAFTLRDLLHRAAGREWVTAAILVGAALSYLVAPQFAFASAVAFLVSELADFAVYTPLAERRWLAAIALSNTVGLVIDSLLFLWLAFGSLEFLPGQIIGKAWMTLAAILAIALVRSRRAVLPRNA
jgi:uncharacterized PurR-regulated membrane protein YhhQ (DUF165 family)